MDLVEPLGGHAMMLGYAGQGLLANQVPLKERSAGVEEANLLGGGKEKKRKG